AFTPLAFAALIAQGAGAGLVQKFGVRPLTPRTSYPATGRARFRIELVIGEHAEHHGQADEEDRAGDDRRDGGMRHDRYAADKDRAGRARQNRSAAVCSGQREMGFP
ncbi:hypothetical protein, partial [Nocardia sp. NPDC004722]